MEQTAGKPLGRAARLIRLAGRGLLDTLLPPSCLVCDGWVDQQGRLCAACFRRTGFVTAPHCVCCGVPFAHGGQAEAGGCCRSCALHPPVFERARAALRYDAQARRIVMPLKYAGRTEIAAALAPLMARAGVELLREADVLVPVPLHRRRLVARRYNQSALLAQAIGRLSGRPTVLDGLRRLRATASLGEKSAAERAAEVADAFAVADRRAPRLAGRRVLLIDDVMTSGATANACAAALLRGGARAVDVLAAARVPDPRLG